jgi:hypothetical protein
MPTETDKRRETGESSSAETIEHLVADGLSILDLDPRNWPTFSFSPLAHLSDVGGFQSAEHFKIKIVVAGASE